MRTTSEPLSVFKWKDPINTTSKRITTHLTG